MKVTKQDLINFGLFDNLPTPLKELDGNDSFVFYYDVDEVGLKLNVYEYNNVKVVNFSLYRDMRDRSIRLRLDRPPQVGFFTTTFESRDGLFFQFLRTYNDEAKVYEFIDYTIAQDELVMLNVATDSINEIYTSNDFRRIMSYFSELSIQPVMMIYDMVNNIFKSKLSKSLYGNSIIKVVNLVKFDGGVLPEIAGRLRYMVIGENANLNEQQKEKLKEAKILIRTLEVSNEDIYINTGWYLNPKDGKWRTNIADNKAEISDVSLYDFNGRKLYVPSDSTIENVTPLIYQPTKLYGANYNGIISDVVKHPTLFDYYPFLLNLPLIYFYGKKVIFNQNGQPVEDFYFSANDRGGYILINGSHLAGDSLSILLHEMQHSIQKKEGFATGGNQFFAQFVISIGSGSVRKVFACINKMERYFRDYLFSDESRLELTDIIKYTLTKSEDARSYRNALLQFLSNYTEYSNNYKTINFYLILFIAEQDDFTTSDLVSYLSGKIGNIVYELFDNVTEGYNSAKGYMQQLLKEGLRDEDIKTVLFKGYENLYGELESRSVQESRFLPSEYKNYFYLVGSRVDERAVGWEHSPIEQITVIDGIEEIINCDEIKAAVEDKDGKYVLHFLRDQSCVPFLHELGHIVYDGLVDLGYKDEIEEEYEKDIFSNNADEFFVLKFLAYLKANVDDDKLREDLSSFFNSENANISKILDEFFTDVEVSNRLKFLQTILSL